MNKKVIISGIMMLVFLASCGGKDDIVLPQDTLPQDTSLQDTSSQIVADTLIPESVDMWEETVIEIQEEKIIIDEPQAGEVMEKEELAWAYVDYSETLIGGTESTVVFFHAAWCPSCVAADRGISSGKLPEGLTVLKADFDTETQLRQKYGVVAQHTFVQVDANGDLIKKWVWGTSVEDIVERIN